MGQQWTIVRPPRVHQTPKQTRNRSRKLYIRSSQEVGRAGLEPATQGL